MTVIVKKTERSLLIEIDTQIHMRTIDDEKGESRKKSCHRQKAFLRQKRLSMNERVLCWTATMDFPFSSSFLSRQIILSPYWQEMKKSNKRSSFIMPVGHFPCLDAQQKKNEIVCVYVPLHCPAVVGDDRAFSFAFCRYFLAVTSWVQLYVSGIIVATTSHSHTGDKMWYIIIITMHIDGGGQWEVVRDAFYFYRHRNVSKIL